MRPVDCSVLLVEDDADTEQLILRALRRAGVSEILVARDGQEALDTLAAVRRQPHLMLLDAKLPTLDGYEVLRRLRMLPSEEALSIVVFSSEDSPAAVTRALSLGATEYAVKPTSFEDLTMTIEQMVHRYAPMAA